MSVQIIQALLMRAAELEQEPVRDELEERVNAMIAAEFRKVAQAAQVMGSGPSEARKPQPSGPPDPWSLGTQL